MNTEKTWAKTGGTYNPANTSSLTTKLEPGVYQYRGTMSGWYLEKDRENFEFPYKIYGNNDHILNRITTTWETRKGNMGVLLNGVRGTGKSITAQQLANWGFKNGIPVLMINEYIGNISDVFSNIQQDLIVIFDEFEKTHKVKEGEQQNLLTALDGMTRSNFKRLFVFTTNDPAIDENMKDRPSRIWYTFEFENLSEDIIMEILDDMLLPEYQEFKEEMIMYIFSRKVVSMDTVKAIIEEVNTWGGPPSTFSNIMNLSQADTKVFNIEVYSEGNLVSVFEDFEANYRDAPLLLSYVSSKAGAKIFNVVRRDVPWDIVLKPMFGGKPEEAIKLRLITSTNQSVFNGHMAVNWKTDWLSNVDITKADPYIPDNMLWLDERPSTWKTPAWTKELKKKEISEEVETEVSEWFENSTLYRTQNLKPFTIKIVPVYRKLMYFKKEE